MIEAHLTMSNMTDGGTTWWGPKRSRVSIQNNFRCLPTHSHNHSSYIQSHFHTFSKKCKKEPTHYTQPIVFKQNHLPGEWLHITPSLQLLRLEKTCTCFPFCQIGVVKAVINYFYDDATKSVDKDFMNSQKSVVNIVHAQVVISAEFSLLSRPTQLHGLPKSIIWK